MPYKVVCADTAAPSGYGVWRVIENVTGRVVSYGLTRGIARQMAWRLNRDAVRQAADR